MFKILPISFITFPSEQMQHFAACSNIKPVRVFSTFLV